VLTEQIAEQLHSHADAHVFTGLPRAGTVRAARPLAEIGDARGRFPYPEALASLAGVAPATRQSGKSRIVGFRWAVDRQLRDALVKWAGRLPAEQRVGRGLLRRAEKQTAQDLGLLWRRISDRRRPG
jgi:transposase